MQFDIRKFSETASTNDNEQIRVNPRWPYNAVFIEESAYRALMLAQNKLTKHKIHLVLTRGYENQGYFLKVAHAFGRMVGAALFCCVYPHRYREVGQIFSANGHNENGRCIDINFMRDGRIISLLPYGVFTPQHIIRRLRDLNQDSLNLVVGALEHSGFVIHSNQTEAMQIHCELRQELRNAV